MMAHNNGEPSVCAQNLTTTVVGECPLSREKGIDPELIDKTITTAEGRYIESVKKVIGRYEPRVAVDSLGVVKREDRLGRYTFELDLEKKEG